MTHTPGVKVVTRYHKRETDLEPSQHLAARLVVTNSFLMITL